MKTNWMIKGFVDLTFEYMMRFWIEFMMNFQHNVDDDGRIQLDLAVPRVPFIDNWIFFCMRPIFDGGTRNARTHTQLIILQLGIFFEAS